MYQFYYAKTETRERPRLSRNVNEEYRVVSVRPAMWEEHCLECSAPLCFGTCPNYEERRDGRCHRFSNSISVFEEERALNGQGAHIHFRKWANMMTVIYPGMLTFEEYAAKNKKNEKLGKLFHRIIFSKLPKALMWQSIRIPEYLRRRSMKKASFSEGMTPDAFVLHCYSFDSEPYRLIMEVYEDHDSKYRTSFDIVPGENLHILRNTTFPKDCSKVGNVVKIYPENDREADIEIYWCDFVKGEPVEKELSAEKVKCVVWDLDNTLWDGILIETENTENLNLRPGVIDTIKTLDERGILQSVASKNDYNTAWPVLEKLGLAEYFLYPEVNWGAKSDSIKRIARVLNIGVDSFAFFDDSEFERNEVKSALPQVRVYDEKSIRETVATAPFDVIVTEESRERRALYRAEEMRNSIKNSESTDITEFLKTCNLEITVFTPDTETEITRCYELVQRTNQLNLSGKKYSRDEFDSIFRRDNHKSFAFKCRDRFGEYGIVCFGQYRVAEDQLVFTEFAMSCRVAGKYIESALFSALLEKENCRKGRFSVIKTKKNQLLRNTLSEIGFEKVKDDADSVDYEFSNELLNKELVLVNI